MTVLRSNSAWSSVEVSAWLTESVIPVRLALLQSDGAPLLCSLWYWHDAGALWCATQRTAHVATLAARDGRCAFEVAGDLAPYRGVRGQGMAQIVPERGPDVLTRLIDRYLKTRESPFARWLLARADREVAIRIEPQWLTSWDFTARMRGDAPGAGVT